eukprot:scaffold5626_cov258-Ochromonas_danica.AAC.6
MRSAHAVFAHNTTPHYRNGMLSKNRGKGVRTACIEGKVFLQYKITNHFVHICIYGKVDDNMQPDAVAWRLPSIVCGNLIQLKIASCCCHYLMNV